MRVKSRKPEAENLMTSCCSVFFQIGRGADDGIGDQMRQMRGDRQHPVVMRRVHDLDHCCRRARHSAATLSTAAASVPGGGVRMHQRPSNSSAKPDVRPGMLGAGDGMARHEMHALGIDGPNRAPPPS